MNRVFYTIGHSTRPLPEFLALLQEAGVRGVADVRAFPHSRVAPHYDGEALREALAAQGMAYRHFARLGGRRGLVHEVDPVTNGFWENRSFHNYADYALGPAFHEGLIALEAFGARGPVAVMCAEAVWWRCHRRIVADYLMAAGCTVFHILGPDTVELARITPDAERGPGGILRYPPMQGRLL